MRPIIMKNSREIYVDSKLCRNRFITLTPIKEAKTNAFFLARSTRISPIIARNRANPIIPHSTIC